MPKQAVFVPCRRHEISLIIKVNPLSMVIRFRFQLAPILYNEPIELDPTLTVFQTNIYCSLSHDMIFILFLAMKHL